MPAAGTAAGPSQNNYQQLLEVELQLAAAKSSFKAAAFRSKLQQNSCSRIAAAILAAAGLKEAAAPAAAQQLQAAG